MKRTCLLGEMWPGWNLEDGRWPGFSSMKVKGRDIWTALNADASTAASDTTAELDRAGLMLRSAFAGSSRFAFCSSLDCGIADLTGTMWAGTARGEGETLMPDSMSGSATLESGGEK